MFEAPDIPGAAEVIQWFGYWPTFHDAEVLSIKLDRSGTSTLAIRAFETTREVDSSGHYVQAKHATVTFYFEGFPRDQYGITNIRIEGFNHQNVLGNAEVKRTAQGYELVLWGCYGVEGSLGCERIRVELTPGAPSVE
jgi:Immunity protein 50